MEEDFAAVPPVPSPDAPPGALEAHPGATCRTTVARGPHPPSGSDADPLEAPVQDLLERLTELDRHLMAMLESAYRRVVGR